MFICISTTIHVPDCLVALVAHVYGHSWVIKVDDDSPYITARELNSGNRDSWRKGNQYPFYNSVFLINEWQGVAHSVSDSVLLSDSLSLTTDHLLCLLHIVLQETIVEHTSVMNIHVYLLIWSNAYIKWVFSQHTWNRMGHPVCLWNITENGWSLSYNLGGIPFRTIYTNYKFFSDQWSVLAVLPTSPGTPVVSWRTSSWQLRAAAASLKRRTLQRHSWQPLPACREN